MSIDKGEALRRALPTDEEMETWRAEHRADLKRRSEADLFNPVNLGHWVDLCELAKVPYVPAKEIARVMVREVTDFEKTDQPPSVIAFWKAIDDAVAAHRDDKWMMRWACCACSTVKSRLSHGEHSWEKSLIDDFGIDDFRAYDIVSEFPEETIAVYARPWIDAMVIENYPVEFRVFVWDDAIVGISSYYPQRAMPNTPDSLFWICCAFSMTAKLILHQTKTLNCPQIEKTALPGANCWTADFIVDVHGKVLFLEGGPPHTEHWGAHPCCFDGGKVSGIALEASARAKANMGLDSD